MRDTFKELRKKFKDNFKNHVVSYYDKGERLEHLIWRIPGSSNGYMEFIACGGNLVVRGDYGDSIFEWYRRVDLKWIAGTDLSYFAEKCQASEYGRDFKSWDSEQLREDIEALLDEHSKNFEDYDHESPNELRDKFEDVNGFDAVNGEFEWMVWLQDYGWEVFGDDWWEYVPMGKYLDTHCKLHWVGLKLAVEALEEKNNGE